MLGEHTSDVGRELERFRHFTTESPSPMGSDFAALWTQLQQKTTSGVLAMDVAAAGHFDGIVVANMQHEITRQCDEAAFAAFDTAMQSGLWGTNIESNGCQWTKIMCSSSPPSPLAPTK